MHEVVIAKPEIDRELPATRQQRDWHGILADGADANLTVGYVVSPVPARADVERALRAVVERHPALRTQIVEGPDGLVQRVAAPKVAGAACRLEPRRTLATADDAEWRVHTLHASALPCDAVPQLRVALDALGGDALVVFTFSHAVCDGVAINFVLQDFWHAFEHPGVAWRDPLPDGTARAPETPLTEAQVAAVLDVYAGSQPLTGLDRPPPREQRWRAAIVDQRFDGVLARALREGDARWGPSMGLISLALVAAALRDVTGQTDLALGLVRSRRGPGAPRVVESVASTFPVRLRLPDAGTDGIARAVRRGIAQADRVWGEVDQLAVRQQLEGRVLEHDPGTFFDAHVNIFYLADGWRFQPLQVGAHRVEPLMPQLEPNYAFDVGRGRHQFRLLTIVVLHDDSVDVRWMYHAGWCDERRIARVVERFAELAQTVGR